MSEYQVLARKYRPQKFKDVFSQDAIVTTLKNAIKQNRLANGYIFCGSRGTGKTTLARIFAKALNCQNPGDDLEPCGSCSSCKEIASSHSLDVLEIDGASNRGIDDIRKINENVGYTPASGKYKIYIIDEVHMLTKEAFNALLKTLEEPPPKVKFFFATTEPHKVLPTILSRCQRFNLNRITAQDILTKLKNIASDLGVSADEEALRLLAFHADGGLRDAESLFDQVIAFSQGDITAATVADLLGLMPKEPFYQLDEAVKAGNTAFAFELAHQIFSEGKDISHFLEGLSEHFRTLLMVKLSQKAASFLNLSEKEKSQYEMHSKWYTEEQCITIMEFLLEAQNQIRYMNSPKIALEGVLIRIIKIQARVPTALLVRRLAELENKIAEKVTTAPFTPQSLPETKKEEIKQEEIRQQEPKRTEP
ncbi:MAG TPA: DNA polymerase III subunit gamma/tau, partial [Parachlamydiaceae bacterium]|nr:DNA polymerase III subunit gamma/tau [Parachlamydiaceae bacterium]